MNGDDSPIEVAATLRGAHELVSHANQELQGAEKDEQYIGCLETMIN